MMVTQSRWGTTYLWSLSIKTAAYQDKWLQSNSAWEEAGRQETTTLKKLLVERIYYKATKWRTVQEMHKQSNGWPEAGAWQDFGVTAIELTIVMATQLCGMFKKKNFQVVTHVILALGRLSWENHHESVRGQLTYRLRPRLKKQNWIIQLNFMECDLSQ